MSDRAVSEAGRAGDPWLAALLGAIGIAIVDRALLPGAAGAALGAGEQVALALGLFAVAFAACFAAALALAALTAVAARAPRPAAVALAAVCALPYAISLALYTFAGPQARHMSGRGNAWLPPTARSLRPEGEAVAFRHFRDRFGLRPK